MTDDLPIDWQQFARDALASADRRDALCRLQPTCPACASPQVQLIDWISVPAEWRCRERGCRLAFTRDLP